MFHTRVKSDAVGRRLDPGFYNPEYVAAQNALARFPIRTMESLRADGAPIGYGVVKPRFRESSVRMVRIHDFSDPFVDLESSASIDPEQMTEFKRSACQPGDLLVAIGGYPGRLGLLPPLPDGISAVNINQHVVRVRFAAGVECYFVTAFLMSSVGSRILARQVSGSVQAGINVEDFRLITVPFIGADAQRYIGNKLRQAERLRERARAAQARLNRLLEVEEVKAALASIDSRSSRLSAQDLRHRLDSKFYGRRALSVYRACVGDAGVKVGDLNPSISNGFEYRQFISDGRPYATVSEMSSGRLELASAPCIPWDLPVPEKARITTTCVLVVRGGSIGFAACVHGDDTTAAVSSDLIRLEFDSEQKAAAVGLFLNSAAGRSLQHKVSYGGVMPKLGQDELLDIPVPSSILARADDLFRCFNEREAAARSSSRLTNVAKLLVEWLVDGRITEAELVTAQKALEVDDRSADRAILRALRQSDAPDARPLIADVDALYALLDASEGQDA